MATNNKLHIVMFPWLAFGHILPYLKLAKLIANKGHKVSFISTPNNINRLQKLSPNIPPTIDLIQLPLPTTPNLPKDAEATIDVPFDKVKYLKIAYDQLQKPLSEFLESNHPDWILFDVIPHWVPCTANKLNIPTALFSIFSASIFGYFTPPGLTDHRQQPEDFTKKPEWVPFETTVGIATYQIRRLFANFTEDDTLNVPDPIRFKVAATQCDIVAIRSSSEFEPEWMQLLPRTFQKPIVEVGLLPTDVADTGTGNESDDCCWTFIEEWLNRQGEESVVYVAFGAETKPNQEEVVELALGLELSGVPFIWAITKQRGSGDPDPTELPPGFEERTRDQGLVYTSWVPQVKILSHASVGGLLIHGGWSSVIEAVQFGKALMLLPFLADQGIIASMIEEKKMGYMVPRNELDGWFSRETLAESVRLVMVEEEGRMYRDNVKEMMHAFGDMGKQDKFVDDFLCYLETHKFIRELA